MATIAVDAMGGDNAPDAIVRGAAEASKSSYGCDYWAVKVDLISAILGAVPHDDLAGVVWPAFRPAFGRNRRAFRRQLPSFR